MAEVRLTGVTKVLRPPIGAPRRTPSFSIRDLNLHVTGGEAVAVLGHNGAGKSTLLRVVAGVFRPGAGCVQVRGRVSAIATARSPFQPDLTVREHALAFGEMAGLHLHVDRTLELAGLRERADAPVRMLSTGQVARLVLACVLETRPDVHLIDEALEVCDPLFRSRIVRHLRSRCRDGGIALVSGHNIVTARSVCDRGVVLAAGKVVYDGAVDDAILHLLARAPATGVASEGVTGRAAVQLIHSSRGAALRVRPTAGCPALQLLVTLSTIHGMAYHNSRTTVPAGQVMEVPLPPTPQGVREGSIAAVITDSCGTVLHRQEFALADPALARECIA